MGRCEFHIPQTVTIYAYVRFFDPIGAPAPPGRDRRLRSRRVHRLPPRWNAAVTLPGRAHRRVARTSPFTGPRVAPRLLPAFNLLGWHTQTVCNVLRSHPKRGAPDPGSRGSSSSVDGVHCASPSSVAQSNRWRRDRRGQGHSRALASLEPRALFKLFQICPRECARQDQSFFTAPD